MWVPDEDSGFFNATAKSPAHFSVAAVLINDRHELAMHHWDHCAWGDNIYSLMHETLHGHEPLESGVARGLQEEFGAQGKLLAYLGAEAQTFHVAYENRTLRKTTAYFLVDLTSIDPARREEAGPESESDILWLSISEAKAIMREQGQRFPDRPDLDETNALLWAEDQL